jgi:hypothetical protein
MLKAIEVKIHLILLQCFWMGKRRSILVENPFNANANAKKIGSNLLAMILGGNFYQNP